MPNKRFYDINSRVCREGGWAHRATLLEAVIKHLVIDVTRVNLRYRGFMGKWEIGSRSCLPLNLCEVSWQRDYGGLSNAWLRLRYFVKTVTLFTVWYLPNNICTFI